MTSHECATDASNNAVRGVAVSTTHSFRDAMAQVPSGSTAQATSPWNSTGRRPRWTRTSAMGAHGSSVPSTARCSSSS
ncbi:hypothetical protein [Actinomadura monticuli]|uniref:Uncharacterized protein n=1 Tax=Actinomadura monticuli TaxID=3097367 RepID=A0ABV4QE31_9ACTN